jgi:hypothetical protein
MWKLHFSNTKFGSRHHQGKKYEISLPQFEIQHALISSKYLKINLSKAYQKQLNAI